MAQAVHHDLLLLIYIAYFLVLVGLVCQRFVLILPCFSLYVLLTLVKAIHWQPYGAPWDGYLLVEPLILFMACLSLVEAAWRAASVLPRWERWLDLILLGGVAIVLLAITLAMPKEWLPLRALERTRWQVYVTIGGTGLLACFRLPRFSHLRVLTTYLLAHGVAESIDYHHAATLEMRWRLYYVQTFGYLAVALFCCYAWIYLLVFTGYRRPDPVVRRHVAGG